LNALYVFYISFSFPPAIPHLPTFSGQSPCSGVVILDAVIGLHSNTTVAVSGIRKQICTNPAAEENVTVEFGDIKDQRLRFKCPQDQ